LTVIFGFLRQPREPLIDPHSEWLLGKIKNKLREVEVTIGVLYESLPAEEPMENTVLRDVKGAMRYVGLPEFLQIETILGHLLVGLYSI
jgi:hypothetical protein